MEVGLEHKVGREIRIFTLSIAATDLSTAALTSMRSTVASQTTGAHCMSHNPAEPRPSFKRLVASHFAKRPGLRAVAAKEGFAALTGRYPWIRQGYPQLDSLQPFYILRAASAPCPLVDALLACFLGASPTVLVPSDQVSLAPPTVFRAQEQGADPATRPEISLSMTHLDGDFTDLLGRLIERYQQALISFWTGPSDASGITPLEWLQQMLKAALLDNVHRQGLSGADRSTLYSLIVSSGERPAVQALQVTLQRDGITRHQSLPDLLIITAPGQRVLWCRPSGIVHSYVSLSAFATALRDALAGQQVFQSMSWAYQPVEGDPFSFQATQLLNDTLLRIGQVQVASHDSVSTLESTFDRVSDPSSYFLDHAYLAPDLPVVELPGWLAQASSTERLDYYAALLELSACQALSQGKSALDDVQDIHRYAVDRLLQKMPQRADGKPRYHPDRVMVTLSVPMQYSSTGLARLEISRHVSLTELMVSRLDSGIGESATGLSDLAGNALADKDLDLDTIARWIGELDIGGNYPAYLDHVLAEEQATLQRIHNYAREWRSGLMFSALKARIGGKLDSRTHQTINDFCHGDSDDQRQLTLAPLAFAFAPGAAKDEVACMFLIKLHATGNWMLYRPLYPEDPVRVFPSIAQLMDCIRTEPALGQSMLDWMSAAARARYANGGFSKPHIHPELESLAYTFSPSTAVVTTILKKLEQPASAAFRPWPTRLDIHMFEARLNAMRQLASRQSVSNSQERWAMLVHFAAVLFNTALTLLRGPAATLAWLVTSLMALKNDIDALSNGTVEQRAMATADLISNVAMLLIHTIATPRTPEPQLPELRLNDPSPEHSGVVQVPAEKPRPREWQPVTEQVPTALTVRRWHANQRLGNLPPALLRTLGSLRARHSLASAILETQGRLRGLFKLQGRHYVKLQDDAYEVQEEWNGMRIIGPDQSQGPWSSEWGGERDGYYIVGRERRKGPWLTRWNEEWVIDLHLPGGMPKSARQLAAENDAAFQAAIVEQVADSNSLARLAEQAVRKRLALDPFDRQLLLFESTYQSQLGLLRTDPGNLPEDMQQSYDALGTLRSEILLDLQLSARCHEESARLMTRMLQRCEALAEPRFAKLALVKEQFDAQTGRVVKQSAPWQADNQRTRGDLAYKLIKNDTILFLRLRQLADHREIERQNALLPSGPLDAQQLQQYTAVRGRYRDVLAIDRRILEASLRLDRNTLATLNDAKIQFADKENQIRKLIEMRPCSSVLLRRQVIGDLYQLTFDRALSTDVDGDALRLMHAELFNDDFRTAAISHELLAGSDLSLADQAEILNYALRQYERATGIARYLQLWEDPALDMPMLDAYIAEVGALKQVAESNLSTVLSDSQLPDPPAPRQVAHRIRPGRRKLIRTSRGRAVLGDEVEGSSQMAQHDPDSGQVLQVYEQREGLYDDTPAPQAGPRNYRAMRERATSLMGGTIRLEITARQYVSSDEPNGLADLMDGFIDNLDELASGLGTSHQDQAMTARLGETSAALRTLKNELLTVTYLNTRHPGSDALNYLHRAGKIIIQPGRVRKRLRAGDFLDVYTIRRADLPEETLWEAHFHYARADAGSHDFSKGHLKFPEPLGLSRSARLEAASSATERANVYRGDLKLAQVEGVIPFPAS